MYRITGHYHGLASQSPRQPAARAYRVQEAAMGPSRHPSVILRPVPWTRARAMTSRCLFRACLVWPPAKRRRLPMAAFSVLVTAAGA